MSALPFLFTLLMLAVVTPGTSQASDPVGWELMQKVQEYREGGNLRQAVQELKQALNKDPDNPKARLLLAQLYVQMGDGASAEQELRLSYRGADSAAMAEAMGEALLLQGKFHELLEKLRARSGLSAEHKAQIHTLRGEAQLAVGNRKHAAREFQTALKIQSPLTRASLGLARIALEDEPDRARGRIDEALEADPDSVAGWLLLGDLHQSHQSYQQAEIAFSKVLELDPGRLEARLKRALVRMALDNQNGVVEDLGRLQAETRSPAALYTQGVLQLYQGRFAEAQDALERVVARVPSHFQSSFYLGVLHYELGQLAEAEQYLIHVVGGVPRLDAASLLLAAIRLARNDFQGAEQVLRPVLSRNPSNGWALNIMGRALLAQGKREAGRSYLESAVSLKPDSIVDRLALARCYLALEAPVLASMELEQALKLEPDLVTADILLMLASLRAGQYPRALSLMERLRNKWPDNSSLLGLRGIAFLSQGDSEAAARAFEEVLEQWPGDPTAGMNLAVLALSRGQLDQAEDYIREVVSNHPDHQVAAMKLAVLEAMQGESEAAERRLKQTHARHPDELFPLIALARLQLDGQQPFKALVTLAGVPEQYARHPVLLSLLGEARLGSGESSSAVRTLQQLVRSQPASAYARYLLGTAYLASSHWSGAREALLKGLVLDPGLPVASQLMTKLASAAPSRRAMKTLLRQIKEVQPDHVQLLDLEAQLALQENQADTALAIYRRLHQRFPDQSVWLQQLARAQWLAGDREGQIKRLRSWLEIHPKDVEVRYMLANSYLRMWRLDLAREALMMVIRQVPDKVPALNNLAWLLRESDPVQAMQYAERALKLQPDNPAVLDTLGTLLLSQQQNRVRALELLRRARTLWPQNSSVLYHYAWALKENGNPRRAIELLERIQNQRFPERRQAIALLESLRE